MSGDHEFDVPHRQIAEAMTPIRHGSAHLTRMAVLALLANESPFRAAGDALDIAERSVRHTSRRPSNGWR